MLDCREISGELTESQVQTWAKDTALSSIRVNKTHKKGSRVGRSPELSREKRAFAPLTIYYPRKTSNMTT